LLSAIELSMITTAMSAFTKASIAARSSFCTPSAPLNTKTIPCAGSSGATIATSPNSAVLIAGNARWAPALTGMSTNVASHIGMSQSENQGRQRVASRSERMS